MVAKSPLRKLGCQAAFSRLIPGGRQGAVQEQLPAGRLHPATLSWKARHADKVWQRAFCASWPQGPRYTEFLDGFQFISTELPLLNSGHRYPIARDRSLGRVLSRLLQKRDQRPQVSPTVPPAPLGFKFKGILSVQAELRGGFVVALAVGEWLELMVQEGVSNLNGSVIL